MVLQLLLALQGLQQHPGFGKAFVGSVDQRHQGQGCLQQHGCVVAGHGQAGAGRLAVEVRAEGAGAREHRETAAALPLMAQFFGCPHHVAGHRLVQLAGIGDRAAEAAAHAGFPLRRGAVLQGQAAHPLQFQLQPQPHHPGLGPQFAAGHVAQLAGIGDAPQPAPAAQLAAHAPDLLHGGLLQPGIGVDFTAQVEHAGLAAIALGNPVGHFRQHLAGGQANGDRQAEVVADAAAQLCGPGAEVAAAWARQPREGLIDRIHLQLRNERLEAAHQPLAHVAIEGVVGAAHHHTVAGQVPGDLEVGLAYANAQLPRFAAARHHAAVVVGEHHHGPADQGWIEGLLAGGIEVVGIDQRQRISHGAPGGGSRGWPRPRSARRRTGAAPAVGRRCWPPPAAAGPGGALGA